MKKVTLSERYSRCLPFYKSEMYRNGALTESLLVRKFLLEFLNPEGQPGLKKVLSLLEETFQTETEQAGRYYFACGVRAAEENRETETVFDL